jgi:hypothetical protein
MKVSERLAIIKRLAQELNSRYDFYEAATFVRAFIKGFRANQDDYHGTEEMAMFALSEVNESVLGEMINDLGIESLAAISYQAQPPNVWKDGREFRIFISHISTDKKIAARLRDAFQPYGIKAFVAHEDIEPTLEWQVQIERALHNMEAFVSIHTKGYAHRFWCQQEIGFAVGKGTKIIALRMDEDPTGFISKNQALSRGKKRAEDVATEIDLLLLDDERTKERYEAAKRSRTPFPDDHPF